jgi:hypothetical protein
MAYNNRETTNAPKSDLFRSIAARASDEISGGSVIFEAVKVVGDTNGAGGKPPPTEVYQATWFWCVRKFNNVTASARGLGRNKGSFERLSFVEVISAGTDKLDDNLNPDYRYDSYKANSTGKRYSITSKTELDLWSYLGEFLSQDVFFHALNRPEDGSLDVGSFLYTSDLGNVTDNIATTLTNQIRSRSPGDNSEAATVNGTALFREVYIHVRWGWFILPMVETVLVGALLIAVMMATHSQPLLKESVVPYILCSGDQEVRSALNASGPVTGEEMTDAANNVSVRLTKLNDEPFSFVLEGRQGTKLGK